MLYYLCQKVKRESVQRTKQISGNNVQQVLNASPSRDRSPRLSLENEQLRVKVIWAWLTRAYLSPNSLQPTAKRIGTILV